MAPYTARKVVILQADEHTCEFRMIIGVAMRLLPSNGS